MLALGHTNWAVFKDLIDEVQPHIKTIIEDMRARYMRGVQKRNKKLEHLRAEITHVFLLAAEHVLNEEYLRDDTLISFMLNYIRELGAFLSDADVQLEWDHQSLRYYFCGLVERLHDNLAKQCRSPDDWVPYDLRYSLFKLMEEWCGHGQRGHLMREREEKMALSVLEQLKDTEERTALTLAMDDQRRALEYASLRAMAVLCQGQLVPANGVKFGASFNLSSLFQWIDAVFQSTDPRLQPIARLALESMLLFNQRDAALWADVISFCYQGHGTVETKHGYFQSLVKILTDVDFQCDPSMILNLILFKLGDTHRDIRQSAAKLLKVVGTRLLRSPFRNDFEVAIMSPSAATYKQGRNLIAAQLANDFAPIHHQFLSEGSGSARCGTCQYADYPEYHIM